MHRFLIESEQKKKGYDTLEVSSVVLLVLLWVWRAAAGNSARAIGPQHLICMVLSSSRKKKPKDGKQGNGRLWKENPFTPCFQGHQGRKECQKQTIPSHCVSKQTGRARKTTGQFSQDAVKHPPVHFSCKKGKGALIPRTEEKKDTLAGPGRGCYSIDACMRTQLKGGEPFP